MNPTPGRSAVLYDVENLLWDDHFVEPAAPTVVPEDAIPFDHLPYAWVGDRDATDLLASARRDAIDLLGGEPDYEIAAGIAHLMRRIAFLAPMQGVAMRVVPAGRDLADHYLLDTGAHLAAAGYTRFVVVSGDHAFAPFVARHRAAVVARHNAVSADLRMAASATRLLRYDQAA